MAVFVGVPRYSASVLLRNAQLAYAGVMVSWKAMEYQRTGQLAKFYSDEAFVPLWWIALVLVIAVCIDAITDPIAAHITDGVRTRWGRRRPFLASTSCLWPLCPPPTLTAVGVASQSDRCSWVACSWLCGLLLVIGRRTTSWVHMFCSSLLSM